MVRRTKPTGRKVLRSGKPPVPDHIADALFETEVLTADEMRLHKFKRFFGLERHRRVCSIAEAQSGKKILSRQFDTREDQTIPLFRKQIRNAHGRNVRNGVSAFGTAFALGIIGVNSVVGPSAEASIAPTEAVAVDSSTLRLPTLPFRQFGQVETHTLSEAHAAAIEAALSHVNADDFDALLGPNHKRVCLQGAFVGTDFLHDVEGFTNSRADRSAEQNVRLGVALANLESGCNPYLMAGGNTTREDIAGGATQFLENEWAIKMMTMRGPLARLAPDSAELGAVLEQVDVIVNAYKDNLRQRANFGTTRRLTQAERSARVDLERLQIFESNAVLPAGQRREGFSFAGVNDIYRDAFNYARDHDSLSHARDVVRDARTSAVMLETPYGQAEMGMTLGIIMALRGADEVTLRTDFVTRVANNMQVRAATDELQLERAEAIAYYGDHQRGRTKQDNLIDCYMGEGTAAFCRRTLAWRAADNRSLYMWQDNRGGWHQHTTVQPVLNNMESMLGANFAEAAGTLYGFRDILAFTDVPSTAIHPRRDAEGREVRVDVTDMGFSLTRPRTTVARDQRPEQGTNGPI